MYQGLIFLLQLSWHYTSVFAHELFMITYLQLHRFYFYIGNWPYTSRLVSPLSLSLCRLECPIVSRSLDVDWSSSKDGEVTASTGTVVIGMAVEVVISVLHSDEVIFGETKIFVVDIISNAEDKYYKMPIIRGVKCSLSHLTRHFLCL